MSDVPFMLHEGPCQETLTPIIVAVEAEQEDEESLQVLANELECPKYCTQEWNPVCGRLMSSATAYFAILTKKSSNEPFRKRKKNV